MRADRPVIGVDIGGTKVAAGLVAADGRVSGRVQVPTPAQQGGAAVLAAVARLVDEVAAPLGDAGRGLEVGIGTAGIVDPRRGVIVGSTDAIQGWVGTQVAAVLGGATARRVTVVNDVTAFLLAERAHGAARGKAQVLAVTVGTGIGGALLVDGRFLRGHRDVAGEVGHLAAPDATGRACPCGATGHVEAVASGPAMTADYARETSDAGVRLPEVVERERAGDPAARAALHRGGTALGATLGGLVNAVGAELVVLGGGVVVGSDVYVTALREALQWALLPSLASTRVALGVLGPDATLVGAAVAAQDALGGAEA